jgi:hypothetical protein
VLDLVFYSVSCIYIPQHAVREEWEEGRQSVAAQKQIITLTIHLRHHTDSKLISFFHEQSNTGLANETEWLILQDTKKISEHI